MATRQLVNLPAHSLEVADSSTSEAVQLLSGWSTCRPIVWRRLTLLPVRPSSSLASWSTSGPSAWRWPTLLPARPSSLLAVWSTCRPAHSLEVADYPTSEAIQCQQYCEASRLQISRGRRSIDALPVYNQPAAQCTVAHSSIIAACEPRLPRFQHIIRYARPVKNTFPPPIPTDSLHNGSQHHNCEAWLAAAANLSASGHLN